MMTTKTGRLIGATKYYALRTLGRKLGCPVLPELVSPPHPGGVSAPDAINVINALIATGAYGHFASQNIADRPAMTGKFGFQLQIA